MQEPVVTVEDIDPVVLANLTQLMNVFSIPSEKQNDVQKWVKAKYQEMRQQNQDVDINALINLFMDEMLGKFWWSSDQNIIILDNTCLFKQNLIFSFFYKYTNYFIPKNRL